MVVSSSSSPKDEHREMEGNERFLSPVKHPFITTSIDPLESSAGNNVFLNPFDGKRWITMVKCKDTETAISH